MRIIEAFETYHQTISRIQTARSNHLGYPYNLTHRSSVPGVMGNWLINNLGDPYAGSHFASEVCGLERDVVAWLMKLWECDEPSDYWGSVGASGTEGNLWAIYLAREALPDATLLYSQDAHYSIAKSARILRIKTREIESHPDGSIDLMSLRQALAELQGKQVILALTCGTTIKGAHDNIAGAILALDQMGFPPSQRFVHIDGALNAMVLPFLEGVPKEIRPSFRLAIDSISTSGHKMIGTAMPCGVLIVQRSHVDRVAQAIAYLRSNDTTLMGSRNGHAVLALWASLLGREVEAIAADVRRCIQSAQSFARTLSEEGVPVLLNPFSLTLVFPEPPDDLVRKYQLASSNGRSHAIVMPSVTQDLIDQFTADYLAWFCSSPHREPVQFRGDRNKPSSHGARASGMREAVFSDAALVAAEI